MRGVSTAQCTDGARLCITCNRVTGHTPRVGSPSGVLALGVSAVMAAHTGNRSLVSVLGRLHLVDEGAASAPLPDR